ncbi:protein I'm not dead yet isoform X2 [Drosophila mauritiana]|uniref:Protein I'm not dead yet isoform X2 n=1 Tax=Drosophila mauritiana TaxID=7226 RepID=A0A6P8LFD1_DROMA|nr:protein I'm not dead yet isoform X2 [Drosophila mauritiana]
MAALDYKPGDIPLEEQDDRRLFCKYHYKGALLLFIPILLAPILIGTPVLICRFIYLTLCLYLIYILNLMARGAAAFIYMVFIPIAGIASSKEISVSYYTDLIFFVYSGIFMGIMMDSSKLSERLAYIVISLVGGSLKFLQIFLTIAAAIVSILVNPTISAAFWMKISQAVMVEYDTAGLIKLNSEEKPYEVGAKPYPTRPVIGIYLTCCYAASLAASLSPIVNPNGVISDGFGGSLKVLEIAMLMAGPALLGLVVMIFWLQVLFLGLLGGSVKRDLAEMAGAKAGFKQAAAERKQALGPWGIYPILALSLILLMFVLVATRKPRIFTGWDSINHKAESGLSVAGIGMSILFFAIPANYIFCRYYVCRQPEKEGPANSLLSWKAVNNNTPWAEIFMLGAAFSFSYSSSACGLNTYLADSMSSDTKAFNMKNFICGALLGTLWTTLSPATTVAKLALPTMVTAGNSFSLPFATALHNQFLLPVSSPANTIIAGWGNVRPFQFLLGGSILALFMFCTIAGFTILFRTTVL